MTLQFTRLTPGNIVRVAIAALASLLLWFESDPSPAIAAEPSCHMVDIDHLQASIAAGDAEWLTDPQLQFARALYIATPPVTWDMPRGDRAVMIFHSAEDSADLILFLDSASSCEVLKIGPEARRRLEDIKGGHTRRVGDPT